MTSIKYALALSAAVAFGGMAMSMTSAVAANTAMADCNKKWNDEKTAHPDTKVVYQDFLKGCLKTSSAMDAKAADSKPADAKAMDAKTTDTKAKATDTAMAKTTAPAVAAVDPQAAAKKACGKEWKVAKDAGTTGDQKKKEFVAACLAKAPAAGTTAAKVTAPAVVPAKTDAKTMDAKATDAADATPPEPAKDGMAKTVDANGKVRTPGQLAMDKRIKECGVEWHKAKGADGMVNGLKWPQYWSQCNKKMKAAGN